MIVPVVRGGVVWLISRRLGRIPRRRRSHLFVVRSVFVTGFAVRAVSLRAAVLSLALVAVPSSVLAAAVSPGAAQLAPVKATPVDGTEVPSLDTARSITWRKSDGTFATRIWQRPVNVKDADGKWVRIDNTLHTVAGGFENGASAIDLKLPAALSEPIVLSHDGDSLSLSLRGSDAKATVDGNTATYADAASGVTAKLSANDAALKEDLVLSSGEASTSFSYDLGLSDGLTPTQRKDGGIDITNAAGDVVFTAPAPVAADADGRVAPADATSLSVEKNAGGGYSLSLSLDPEWLAGAALPVTLDPSFSVDPATRDCYLSQAAATTSYCTSGELRVGHTAAGANENTALAYFAIGSVVPAGSFVQNAELDLSPLYQTSPGTSKNLSVHQVTSAWANTATWNTRSGSTAWTTAGGDYSATDLDTQPLPTTSSPSTFTVTDAVASWVTGASANGGLAVTDDGSTANNAQVYASSDWSDSTKWPSLYVEYYGRLGWMSNYTINSQAITDKQTLGVNVAGGNLLLTDNELHVDGNRLPLDITRFYNSQDPWSGSLRNGRLSVGQDIVLYDCDADHDRCFIGPSGFRVRFKKTGATTYQTPAGIGDETLSYNASSSQYELTDNKSGVTYVFFDAPFSYMTQIHDRDGNHIDFAYTGPGNQLSSITDTRGRTYTVAPVMSGAATGKIKSITAPNSITGDGDHTWTYGYNATTGDLTSETDANGKTTSYHYNGSDNIDQITDPLGHVINIGYDSSQRVTSITRVIDGTTANDLTTTFAYSTPTAPCSTSG
ncbi:MAG: DNRLRE domain-containing protein, partial [Patulibacter sp.]|nr:DNRLRE domain-containing protein [Patulibacter sp.]